MSFNVDQIDRITLDFDDELKVNDAKFADLLAEVKAVRGKNPDGE